MAKKVRLGVFGLGTVGSGLMRLIHLRQDRLLSTTGIQLEVAGAVVKNPAKARPGMEQLAISAEPGKLLDDPEVDIIVELINEVEPALDICRRALSV